MNSPPGTLTQKFRRNGKLQSCETCRKSKLRCDHVVPACGRCVRRGKASTCFYHPNPLTQQQVKARQTPSSSYHSIPTPKSVSESTTVSPRNDAVLPSVEGGSSTAAESHVLCQPFHRAASAPPLVYHPQPEARRNTGFQGATSHYTILNEGLHILEPDPMDVEAMGSDHEDIVITNSRINQGCKLLAFFKNKTLIDRLLERRNETCDGAEVLVIWPILQEWMTQIWRMHSDALLSQDPVKIRTLSERIWRNTLTPLRFDGGTTTTAHQWAQLGTGDNLRWEVVGLLVLNLNYSVIEAAATAHLFVENKVSRACLLAQLTDIAEKCLVFCRVCGGNGDEPHLDDLFVWLLLEHATAVATLKGHRHYATYRATGEAHSAVLAMGLHQAAPPSLPSSHSSPPRIPFFLAELRKRAFLIAYYSEISIATLLGRPPRLSHRYSSISPPLDLSAAQLVDPATPAALNGGASPPLLDEQGYNTAGTLQRSTVERTLLHYCQRREDILDLALDDSSGGARYDEEAVLARAAAIEAANAAYLASLPSFLRALYTAEDDVVFAEDNKYTALQMLSIGAMRTAARANEMLLQRVLLRKTARGGSVARLTAAASAVLRDVLRITARVDLVARWRASCNAYLSSHGLRSAAILAIELLKQEMKRGEGSNDQEEELLLPRSRTIQDLAVFAARLAAVDPSDGAASLCVLGNRVLSRILDRILSPGGARGAVARQQQQQQLQQSQKMTRLEETTTAAAIETQEQIMMHGGGISGEEPLAPPLNTMMMVALPSDMAGYGMMDVGIGIDAPMSLGQDTDFMRWMEGMNWERMDSWGM